MSTLIIPVVFAYIKGPKMHDIKQQLEIIWEALHSYREDCISEGDERNDEIWEDICLAMAVIEENLKVAA